MTNEEMLLRALMGEKLTVTEFHPQTNEQAYLAYAVGLITDQALLPEPRTNTEVLLLQVALNGTGGTELPEMTNPANPSEILDGYEAIDQRGQVIRGTVPDFSGTVMHGYFDQSRERVNVPRGFHDGYTGVAIPVEGLDVTPSDKQQVFHPSDGCVIGKVTVAPAQGSDFVITDADFLFNNGSRLEDIDNILSVCKGVTTADNMFSNCSFLTNLNLKGFDSSKIRSMMYMFNGCSSLTTLDLSEFDTSSAQNMGSMFRGCSKLVSLDLSNFDTSKVYGMTTMFENCKKLEEIIGMSATNSVGMFVGFPVGTSSSKMALRRLLFRTDLPEGVYSIRSAIKISHCSFARDGMVEMFNTLPDLSQFVDRPDEETIISVELDYPAQANMYLDDALYNGLVSDFTRVTIITEELNDTQDGTVTRTYTGTVEDICYGNTVEAEGGLPVDLYEINAITSTLQYPVIVNNSIAASARTITITGNPCVTDGTLTAEDRLIATNKGWLLVE